MPGLTTFAPRAAVVTTPGLPDSERNCLIPSALGPATWGLAQR